MTVGRFTSLVSANQKHPSIAQLTPGNWLPRGEQAGQTSHDESHGPLSPNLGRDAPSPLPQSGILPEASH